MTEMQPTGTDQMLDPLGLGIPVPSGTGGDNEVPWKPPVRLVRNPSTNQFIEFAGPGIIDALGNPVTDESGQFKLEYDLYTEPTTLYFSLDSLQRQTLLDVMESKGASVGTPDRDIRAITQLMTYANNMGRDYESTLRILDQMLPDKEDQKPRYRVSSSRDLRAVFDETAKSTIGRGFTEEEMARAINAYQAGERGVQSVESGVVESMASPSVYGADFARQTAPTEAQAFTYLGFMDRTMKKAASRVV